VSRAIALGPWPPIASGIPIPLAGWVPAGRVVILCQRHSPIQFVAVEATMEFTFRILAAFRVLPDVLLESAGSDAKLVGAMQLAGPLCCALGDATVEQIQRQVPAVWALRN
jgi:hypothetical protein